MYSSFLLLSSSQMIQQFKNFGPLTSIYQPTITDPSSSKNSSLLIHLLDKKKVITDELIAIGGYASVCIIVPYTSLQCGHISRIRSGTGFNVFIDTSLSTPPLKSYTINLRMSRLFLFISQILLSSSIAICPTLTLSSVCSIRMARKGTMQINKALITTHRFLWLTRL